ncbi:hypothetical protein HDU79_008561 [Rhizoclosmatium sp. JEL0117]|nr:hypothetical protein HDU79_008561 [Rhizoclosmatium sp. JEL0117]
MTCPKITAAGHKCGKPGKNGSEYCQKWNHFPKCGSTRTNTNLPCGRIAVKDFFPFCCAKHDIKRLPMSDPQQLRSEGLRDNVLEDVFTKVKGLDVYLDKEITRISSDTHVEHVIELHWERDVVDSLKLAPQQQSNLVIYLRDEVVNHISNLVLTSAQTNGIKFRAAMACSESWRANNLNPSGFTHYLKNEFDNAQGLKKESCRVATRNIKNEIVKVYDSQQELLKTGLEKGIKYCDAFDDNLHRMLTDIKVLV